MSDFKDQDWIQYRKLILSDLERHEELLEKILIQVNKTRTEVALLQLRAGLWGLAAGCLPVIMLLLMQYVKGTIN